MSTIYPVIVGAIYPTIGDPFCLGKYGGVLSPPISDKLLVWLKGGNTGNLQKLDSWPKPYRENFDVLQSSCCSVNGVDEELVFSFALPGDATITYQGTATAVLDVPNNKITFSSAGTFYDLRVFTEA